jgi:hypothetical protein
MPRFWLAVLVLPVCMVGCLDRARVNARCEWDEKSVQTLNLNDWSQQRHLYEDVELAEELAIRYADAAYKERSGFEGHGGLIENGRLRDRCMAAFMTTIAATHNLPLEHVEQARLRGYRDQRWDFGVLSSFACLYGFIAWMIVRAISRRFPVDDGWPALVAPLLASVPIGMAAFQLFTLWGGGLEAIRLGNGHVSGYRAAKSPWADHTAALWIAGVTVFVLIAGIHYWLQKRRQRQLYSSGYLNGLTAHAPDGAGNLSAALVMRNR